jgi:hypothetical protein
MPSTTLIYAGRPKERQMASWHLMDSDGRVSEGLYRRPDAFLQDDLRVRSEPDPRRSRGAPAARPGLLPEPARGPESTDRAMGDPGLEPGTSSLSEKRSNRLS